MPPDPTSRQITLVAAPEDAGLRLDRWIADKIGDVSRSRLQGLIRSGHVVGNGTIREPRTPVKPGVSYVVNLPLSEASNVKAEIMPLNIVYEDDDLLVIDKPAGIVVHPSVGHGEGTLVNALLAHCGDSLSGIGGVKRPGIVHRLDKDTSGLLVVAKTDAAHQGLSDQFKSHGRDGRLHRHYLAFVWGTLPRPKGIVDARLARSRSNRMKIGVVQGERGRSAITHYEVLGVAKGSLTTGDISLLRLTLETGRTHQIRVHLAHIGHPVLADPTYGAGFKTRLAALDGDTRDALDILNRQALHASELGFEHPITARKLIFHSPLPPDLAAVAKALKLEESTPPYKAKPLLKNKAEISAQRNGDRRAPIKRT